MLAGDVQNMKRHRMGGKCFIKTLGFRIAEVGSLELQYILKE